MAAKRKLTKEELAKVLTTRDYLWRYRAAVLEREDADTRIAKFEAKYKTARSQQGTGMPTSHDTEHDLSDYLTGREELIDFFVAKQSECLGIEVDIHKRIDMIEGKDHQETADMRLVLRYRYIDGLQWWQAAKKLHVSIRKAQYLETEAALLFPLPNDWAEKCARLCAFESDNV